MPVRDVRVRDHDRRKPHQRQQVHIDDYTRRQEVKPGPPPGAAELGPREEIAHIEAAARARGEITDDEAYRMDKAGDDLIGDHLAGKLWGEMDTTDREHWLGPISGIKDRALAQEENYNDLPADTREKLNATRHIAEETAIPAPGPGERYLVITNDGGHIQYLLATQKRDSAIECLRFHRKLNKHLGRDETVEVVVAKNMEAAREQIRGRGKHDWIVTGDTYENRDYLRAMGLKYDHNRGGYRGKLFSHAAHEMQEVHPDLKVAADTEFTEEERHASKGARAERKAEKYEKYAGSARARGESDLQAARERSDRIPMGQPILVGHHSERGHRSDLERIDRSYERGFSELKKAESHERKARNIRAQGSRRKGDAAAARQAERDAIKPQLSPGSKVFCPIYGSGTVVKVHQKSARISYDRGFTNNTDLSLLRVPEV